MPVPRRARRRRAGSSRSSHSRLLPQDAWHAEALVLHLRRTGEGLLDGQTGTYDVLPEYVGQRQRVRGRRYVVGGHVADRSNRVQDHRQLRRKVVELGVGQVDPREVGKVPYLLTGDVGHGATAPSYTDRRATPSS